MAICRCEHLKPSQRLCLLCKLYLVNCTSLIPLRAYALRYIHLSASSLRTSGSGVFFFRAGASLSRRRAQPEDGTPLPMLFRPTRGLSNSAGVRPRVRYILVHPVAEALRTSYFVFHISYFTSPPVERNNIGRGVPSSG